MFEKKNLLNVIVLIFCFGVFASIANAQPLPPSAYEIKILEKLGAGSYKYEITGVVGPIQGTGTASNFFNTWSHSIQFNGTFGYKFGLETLTPPSELRKIEIANPAGGPPYVYYQFKVVKGLPYEASAVTVQVFEDGVTHNGDTFIDSTINFQALINSYELAHVDPACMGPVPPAGCPVAGTPEFCALLPSDPSCTGGGTPTPTPVGGGTPTPTPIGGTPPTDCTTNPFQPGCPGYYPGATTPPIATVPVTAGCGDWSGITDMDKFVTCIAEWGGRANLFIIGAGILGSLFLLPFAGYMYASGNPGNIEKASEIVTSWMWGIILLLIAGFIINIIGTDIFGVS